MVSRETVCGDARSNHRVGVVSPIGIGVSEFWKSALAGRSGISAIPSFDPFPMGGYRSKVAGQVLDFATDRYLTSTSTATDRPLRSVCLLATKEALADRSLDMAKENPHRVGVIVGAGMGGMVMGEREITPALPARKPHRVHPNFIPVITLNSASGIIAMAYGAKGPNLTISTACSSSAHALGQALHCIREGRADVVITVGAEASITPLVFAGFCSSARALVQNTTISPRRPPGPSIGRATDSSWEKAPGPLSWNRRACQETQGEIYAEIAGYAATSEAYHMVIPREDGLEVAIPWAGPRRCRDEAAAGGLHQCPCHIDDYRRRR